MKHVTSARNHDISRYLFSQLGNDRPSDLKTLNLDHIDYVLRTRYIIEYANNPIYIIKLTLDPYRQPYIHLPLTYFHCAFTVLLGSVIVNFSKSTLNAPTFRAGSVVFV